VAYRAEIEIGVRGQERLNRLQNQISQLANQITRVNDESIFDPVAPRAIQSIENYSNAVSVAAANLREAALGTQEETNAVRQYVQALGEANAARSRQNSLIAQEVANRRTVRPGDAGLGQQTPALPPALVKQQGIKEAWRAFFQEAAELATDLRVDAAAKGLNIQTSWNTFFTEATDLANDLKTNAAAKRLAIQTSWNNFFTEAADLATDLKNNAAAKRLNIQTSWNNFFEDAAAVANDLQRQAQDTRRRIQNAGYGVQGPALPPKTTGPSSPIKGGFDIPGSPAFKQARFQGVALGAGFPLLFGGGPGAVLGGAAGGLVGGPAGFAAQIALSAIGTQFDTFGKQAIEMGTALNSTASALELMREKSLFSSDAVAERAYQLEQQGRVEELAALLTADLARAVGNEGVEALKGLGTETAEATRLWNLLTAQLNVLIAGPLTSFLQLVNQVLGEITAGQQIASLKKDLSPADLKRLQQRERELGTVKGGRIASELGTQSIVLTPEAQQQILKEFGGLRKTIPSIPVTSQDRRDITAPKPKKDKGAADAAREAERVAKVLIQQRAITLEIQRQSTFSAKIAAAEAAKDPLLVRRLKGEQELTELGVKTAKALELEKNSAAQLAIARAAQAKADLIRQKTAQDTAAIEQKRREDFQNTIRDLDYELKIKQAVTEEDRERLRIEAEIAKLRGQNIYSEQQLQEIQERKQKLAAPVLGADLIRKEAGQIKDELKKLTDIGTQIVGAAKAIGDAFSNSFKGIISGAMTAQEALASFFQNIADYFLDMAAQIIAKWIQMTILNSVLSLFPSGGGAGTSSNGMFGAGAPTETFAGGGIFSGAGPYKFPKKAAGGSVSSGKPYIVGELGPELFVPGKSGTIVPNNKLGGGDSNIVVNVDAGGSSVQGDDSQANQLGKVIGAAVQAELIKQKKPGGLLA